MKVTWKERLDSIKLIWGIGLLFFIVMGGIYSGFVTATEAAAIGAFGALAIGIASKRLPRSEIFASIKESVHLIATILILIGCAIYFGHFLALSRMPIIVSEYLSSLSVSPILIFWAIMAFYAGLGCILDSLSIMLLTMPIIFPVIVNYGYSPIWFGVVVVLQVELGALTPPFGINLFVLKASLPEVEMGTIIRGVTPFIIADIVLLVIYVIFPQLSLFLPNLMTV